MGMEIGDVGHKVFVCMLSERRMKSFLSDVI